MLFLNFRSRKYVTSLFGILKNFGVFISAKCCGSLNKFNTYFLRSLDSSLFFRKRIFYIANGWALRGTIMQIKNLLGMVITVELASGQIQCSYEETDSVPQVSKIHVPCQARSFFPMCLVQRSSLTEFARCWKKRAVERVLLLA